MSPVRHIGYRRYRKTNRLSLQKKIKSLVTRDGYHTTGGLIPTCCVHDHKELSPVHCMMNKLRTLILMRMMSLLLVVGLFLIACPVEAADPNPTVLLIPTPVISDLIAYLNTRPYGEISKVMNQLQMCIAVQIPSPDNATLSKTWCPSVVEALAAQEALKEKSANPAPTTKK